MIIECPICEDRFDLPDLDESGKISCPTCKRAFTPPQQGSIAAGSASSLARLTSRSSGEDPPPISPRVPPPQRPQPPTTRDAALQAKKEINRKSVAVIQHHRSLRKYQPWLLGMASLGLIGVASVLTLLILNANQSTAWVSDEEAKLKLISQDLVDAAKAEQTTGQSLAAENSLPKIKKPEPAQKIQPIPQPTARIIRPGQLDACWTRARPFILKLTAETPLGPRSVTGTIVDSRGWVATSYRAIQGAREIEVTQSPKTTGDLNSSGLLTDKVRGIIATDPDHDLAILAVNRRFIVSFSDLPLLEKESLVSSEHLIQCVAPTQKYPWSTTECRIDRRGTLSELSDELAASLQRLQMTDPKTNWIVHKNNLPLSVGAPLLTTDGQLVAINVTVAASSDVSLAIPAGYLKDLLADAIDQPVPLPVPVLSQAVSTDHHAMATAGGADNSSMPALPVASANRSLSVLLNQAGSDCEDNGWWPETQQDMQSLIQFAALLLQAHDLMSDDSATKSDTETISKQITYWSDKFRLNLRPGGLVTSDDKRVFNELLDLKSNRQPQPFIAFADIHFSAMESPSVAIAQDTREDSVTFQLVGTQKNVITNLDPLWPPLRPDSPWLIVGQTVGTRVKISGGDRIETAQLAKIRFVFPAVGDP